MLPSRRLRVALRIGGGCAGKNRIGLVSGRLVSAEAAILLAVAQFENLVVFLPLIRVKFIANVTVQHLHLLVHLGGNGFPKHSGAFGALSDEFFDALVLLGSEIQIAIHAAEQFARALDPWIHRLPLKAVSLVWP